jgi:hypothetical protein
MNYSFFVYDLRFLRWGGHGICRRGIVVSVSQLVRRWSERIWYGETRAGNNKIQHHSIDYFDVCGGAGETN